MKKNERTMELMIAYDIVLSLTKDDGAVAVKDETNVLAYFTRDSFALSRASDRKRWATL